MDTESWLMRIPRLGYFFRKAKENLEALKRTLRTGKETKRETRKRSFCYGLLGISSDKKFDLLRFKKTERKTWLKLRQK